MAALNSLTRQLGALDISQSSQTTTNHKKTTSNNSIPGTKPRLLKQGSQTNLRQGTSSTVGGTSKTVVAGAQKMKAGVAGVGITAAKGNTAKLLTKFSAPNLAAQANSKTTLTATSSLRNLTNGM